MDNRNMLIAIVMSIAILAGWQFFVEIPRMKHQRELEQAAKQEAVVAPPETVGAQGNGTMAPASPASPAANVSPMSLGEALAKSPRVKINSPRIVGSIALTGGRIDDVELVDYHVAVDPESPRIQLFAPPGTEAPYFAEFGWVAAGGEKVALPGPDTVWTADHDALTAEQPVKLSWDNGQGLTFVRIFAVDDNYMFTVTQRVENHGQTGVSLFPYALISRIGTPPTSGYAILYEGPIGYLNHDFYGNPWFASNRHVAYKDLKEHKDVEADSTGGWLGITDKYWLAAIIPDPAASVKARFSYAAPHGTDQYQADFLGAAQQVAPGGNAEYSSRLFAGAKEVRLLDHYADNDHIDRFDLAVDWGLFYFLTKPIFYVLNTFHSWLGNFGLAILLLTVIIKALFFPLANKSYRAMSKMKALQPEMAKLRERLGDDRARLNQEMMELYKREKVNPAAGCLPIIVQIPVFFALYKVLFVTIEMRHAPFFGWIKDLSAPDPLNAFTLFGLIHWDPTQLPVVGHFLDIGLWAIIMGITMFLQQKLNPPPPDPVQARIFQLMPIIFTFLLARFPVGLVIYWAWNNTLSIAQQWLIMRRAGVKPGAKTT